MAKLKKDADHLYAELGRRKGQWVVVYETEKEFWRREARTCLRMALEDNRTSTPGWYLGRLFESYEYCGQRLRQRPD